MDSHQFDLLLSDLCQDKILSAEVYKDLTQEQRKNLYNKWLISEGYSSASAYVNSFPRDIEKFHKINPLSRPLGSNQIRLRGSNACSKMKLAKAHLLRLLDNH